MTMRGAPMSDILAFVLGLILGILLCHFGIVG